jgi:hypothetical protein
MGAGESPSSLGKTHTHLYKTSMSWVGFEPTITVPERAKAVHALDRSATLTGRHNLTFIYLSMALQPLWILAAFSVS